MSQQESTQQKVGSEHDYIPFSEALDLWQPLDKNAFNYRARKGDIAKIPGATERDTRYSAKDITAVREKELERRKKKSKIKRDVVETEVDWQKISDLPAILKLDLKVYKEETVGDIGLYIAWERKNPKITLLSFEKGNRENIFAYLSLVPLPEDDIIWVLKDNDKELAIKPENIESYDRKGAYTLLAESIVADPDHSEQLNKIIRDLFDFWYQQYPERYVEKIYARADSKAGDIFIRKLFFSPLYDISDEAYVLDLRKPGIAPLIKRFQENLVAKDEEVTFHR